MSQNRDKNPSKKQNSIEIALTDWIEQAGRALFSLLGLGFTIVHQALKVRKFRPDRHSIRDRLLISVGPLVGGFLFLVVARLIYSWSPAAAIVLGFVGVWAIGGGLAASLYVLGKLNDAHITVEDLKNRDLDFSEFPSLFQDPNALPLGISLTNGEVVTIPAKQLPSHSLTCGPTGQGKTTLLISKIRHFAQSGRPIIVIDPKGEAGDLELIQNIVKEAGRENDLRVFSLAFPTRSAFYDALAIGTPEQRKAKLLDGFDLTHEYYGSIADDFLGGLFDVLHFLKRPVNFEILYDILLQRSNLAAVEQDLRKLDETPEVMRHLRFLHSSRSIGDDELKGLRAQVGSFNRTEIRPTVIPDGTKSEINLMEVLSQGQIAYFQMNVNAYGPTARALGKIIIQDLKLVSNLIQSGHMNRNYDVAMCAVDEFGSFATAEFSDFLKMVRSAGIFTDLYFQSLADLSRVSPQFTDQVMVNTALKVVLQQDIDAEAWSKTIGTMDTEIQSYQTEEGDLGSIQRTGVGNIHDGKKMVVEFDVFKRLSVGQAVVIDRLRHRTELVSLWNSRAPVIDVSRTLQSEIPRGVTVRFLSSKELF